VRLFLLTFLLGAKERASTEMQDEKIKLANMYISYIKVI